jgi:sigma-B regulation protein RsbU (phosphoserine phosphatase)
MLPGMRYQSETHFLPSGSRIFLYTDGLTEAFSVDDEEFGPERLIEVFCNSGHPLAGPILDTTWKAIGTFSSHAPQTDDMTALAICHLVPSPQEQVNP